MFIWDSFLLFWHLWQSNFVNLKSNFSFRCLHFMLRVDSWAWYLWHLHFSCLISNPFRLSRWCQIYLVIQFFSLLYSKRQLFWCLFKGIFGLAGDPRSLQILSLPDIPKNETWTLITRSIKLRCDSIRFLPFKALTIAMMEEKYELQTSSHSLPRPQFDSFSPL